MFKPSRDPDMLLEYSVKKPLNREPPIKDLVDTFITDADVAYDRNHGPLPHIDAKTFRLHIRGAVSTPLDLSAEVLHNKFTQHEVIAALQCAGNRRHTMRTVVKEVDGLDWNDGAVCNCTWSGPLLADVLESAGLEIRSEDGHVCFDCWQTDVQDDDYYGASIPLTRCMDRSKKIILALEMNGRPLTVNHGYPIRAVVPGIAGARWTKWLDSVIVQSHESQNYYMQRDYKILPPEVTTKALAAKAWASMPAIQGLPINSIIAYPTPGSKIRASRVLEIGGYALPQADDGPVVKVELSIDRGETWSEAEIIFPTKHELESMADKYKWAWAIWRYRVLLAAVDRITKNTKIWCRATDACGNMQDSTIPWNYRGVAYNAYGETGGLEVINDIEEEFTNGIGELK